MGYNWMTMRYEPVDQVTGTTTPPSLCCWRSKALAQFMQTGTITATSQLLPPLGHLAKGWALSDAGRPRDPFHGPRLYGGLQEIPMNYASVFRNEVRELFGGLMANNSEKYGWCVLTHPTSRQPIAFADRDFSGLGYNGQNCTNSYRGCFTMDGANPVKLTKTIAYDDTGETCANGERLYDLAGISLEPEPMYTFPTTRFRIPMLAAYYGMALLVDNYDRSFMDSVRLWIAGDKYQITPPPDAEVATCEDLFSGRIYKTYRMRRWVLPCL